MHFSWLSPFSRGYWCLNLETNKVIILRHFIFDEFTFPNSSKLYIPKPPDYEFLDSDFESDSHPLFIRSYSMPIVAQNKIFFLSGSVQQAQRMTSSSPLGVGVSAGPPRPTEISTALAHQTPILPLLDHVWAPDA